MGKLLSITLACSLWACSYAAQVADPDLAAAVLSTNLAAVPADGVSRVTLALVATQSNRRGAPGLNVNFRSLSAGAIVTGGTLVTDADGRASAYATSTQAGTTAFVVDIEFTNGRVLTSDPIDVTFTPVAADVSTPSPVITQPSQSTSTFLASPSQLVADGVSQAVLSLTLVDVDKNPCPNITVEFSGQSDADVFTATTAVTDANGYASTRLRSTSARIDQVIAQFGDDLLSTNVHFLGGPATHAVLEASPAAPTQGTYVSVTVTLADAYDNASSFFNGTVSLAVDDATAQLGTLSHVYVNSDAGVYTFVNAAMFAQPGTKTFTATAASSSLSGNVAVIIEPFYRNRTAWQSSLGAAQCLAMADYSNVVDEPLLTAPCTFRSNQIFDVGSDGSLRVMGLCVAYDAGSVSLARCDGSLFQQWQSVGSALKVCADPNLCLDAGASTGNTVRASACAATPGQQWRAKEVSAQTSITGTLRNLALDVAGANMNNGTVIDAVTYNATSAQIFTMAVDQTLRVGSWGGSQTYCVEVSGGSFVSGQPLDLHTCNNGIEQMWVQQGATLRPRGDTSLCLDANVQFGAGLTVDSCTGAASQNIALQPASLFYHYVEAANPNLCWTFGGTQGDDNRVISSSCLGSMLQTFQEDSAADNAVRLLYPRGSYYVDAGQPPAFGNVVYTTANDPCNNMWRPLAVGDAWLYASVTSPSLTLDANAVSEGAALVVKSNSTASSTAAVYRAPAALQLSMQVAPTQCFVASAAPAPGVAIRLAPCSDELSNRLIWGADGSLQFGDLCLDAPQGDLVSGAQLSLAACDFSDRQAWNCGVDLTQPLRIFNKSQSDLCLDANGSTNTGAPLTVQSCTTSATPATQMFVMR